MLCELLDTKPEQVLQSFINDLSQELASSGSDERMLARDYFMRCGYGMYELEYENVDRILGELEDIRRLFYDYGNDNMEEYRKEARKRYKAWFQHWQKEKKKRGL